MAGTGTRPGPGRDAPSARRTGVSGRSVTGWGVSASEGEAASRAIPSREVEGDPEPGGGGVGLDCVRWATWRRRRYRPAAHASPVPRPRTKSSGITSRPRYRTAETCIARIGTASLPVRCVPPDLRLPSGATRGIAGLARRRRESIGRGMAQFLNDLLALPGETNSIPPEQPGDADRRRTHGQSPPELVAAENRVPVSP